MLLAAIFLMAGCSNKAPPVPLVKTEKAEIPVKQGSYCWGRLGCAHYAEGRASLQGEKPAAVPPAAHIHISYD